MVQIDKNAKQNKADTFNHLDRTSLVKLDQKNVVDIRSFTGKGKCSHAHCVRRWHFFVIRAFCPRRTHSRVPIDTYSPWLQCSACRDNFAFLSGLYVQWTLDRRLSVLSKIMVFVVNATFSFVFVVLLRLQYQRLRVVFTSDGVGVGVGVVRALMTKWKSKIGVVSVVISATESESNESERFHFFRLRLRLRRFSRRPQYSDSRKTGSCLLFAANLKLPYYRKLTLHEINANR